MSTDPIHVAETLVRDCLETLIQRHEWRLARNAREMAEAEALIALASSLIEHLGADAKQMRAEQS